MTTTSTLTDRIRKIDLRDPETLDVFELRARIEKALEDLDLDLPERSDIDEAIAKLDVLGLRDLVEKIELPEFEVPEFDRTDIEEAFDRFDVLGVRKAIVGADKVEFSMPSSPADVISQLDDVRASFESIVRNLADNAQDLAPVTRKDLADLEKRVVAAEKAAKKAPARKRTTKKAAAKKA